MAAQNSIGIKNDGIPTFTASTGVFTASTPSQYNVQVGGASNNLVSIAPSATSGIPLISQGSSSNPAFGTAVVAGGGTGSTSFTAYSIIAAGTSSTGALQNVSGVGTSGQVLVSNGAGALPTWQSSPGGNSTPVSLSQQGLIWDDFTYGFSGTPVTGDRFGSWYVDLANSGKLVVQDGSYINTQVYGVLSLDTDNATTNGQAALVMQGGSGGQKPFKLGNGVHTYTFLVYTSNLSGSSNRFTYRFGLTYDNWFTDPTEGAWFQQVDNVNSGNFTGKTANGSTTTTVNTTQAPGSRTTFQIQINANRTQVDFYSGSDPANLTLLGSSTTNLPTSGHALAPFMSVVKSTGTTYGGFLAIDLFIGTCDFTTARY